MEAFFIICIIIGSLVLIYFALCIAVAVYMFLPKKRDDEMLIKIETEEKHFDKKWLDIPCEYKTMTSDYGYKLSGRFYKNDNKTDKIILSLHGHNSSGIGQLKYLNIFLSLGYNVFIPDHRRSGRSEGKSISFGCFEKRDVEKWINLLAEEYPAATFALFGESMGAATAMLVTGMDKRIRFLIEYCGFANLDSLIAPIIKYKFFYKLLAPGIKLTAAALFNVDSKECDALSAMKTITVPTMIIHSKADKLVYFSNAEQLIKVRPDAKVLIFEDCKHARSWVAHPEEFTAAITEFIKEQDK